MADETGIVIDNTPQAEEMPNEAPAVSRDTLLEMVAEGQRILGQGRADEALSIGESVLESDPNFVPGLALMGDVLERKGDIAGALASYEKVLELKPDSALDRIRAAHLKRQLASMDLEVDEAPTKKTALLASAAAFVLFLVVVGAVIMFSQLPAATGQQVASNADYQMSTFSVPPVPTAGQPQAPAQQQPGAQQNQGSALPPSAGDPAVGRVQNPNPGFVPPPRTGGSRAADPDVPAVEPVNPLPNGAAVNIQPTGPGAIPVPAPAAPPQGQPAGAAIPQPDTPETISNTTPERDNPGIIEIRPSQGQGTNRVGSSGSTQADDDQEARQSAESLIRVARDAFVKGDYSRAADAYERALRLGASRGSTNQRLAQVYQRMGRNGEAASAYERAIAGYQAMLTSGSGDSSRINAAIDSCRQALKNLRG